jgi:MoaA/NifB/PqqE/SkfB family radical SAM enzyme
MFREGHPAVDVIRHFWHHPKAWRYQVQIVRLFVLNAVTRCHWRRLKYEHDTGIFPPTFIVLSPTNRCNLSCVGCYASSQPDAAELSWEEAHNVVAQCRALGMPFIAVSGGEPFAWPGLLDLVEENSDIMFLIYTNGTLITPDHARRMARAANVAPALSVEGGRPETDARRGPGVYARLEKAFTILRDAHVLYGFSTTVTRRNFDVVCADRFRAQQIARGCAFGWLFQYVPVGCGADLDLMTTARQRLQLQQRVAAWRAQGGPFVIDFWGDGPMVGGCIAAGRRYLHVNARGDIEPCTFLKHTTHNIRTHSLHEAIASPFFTAIRARQKAHPNLLRPCFLVDYPAEWRALVEAHGAYSTDGYSDRLLAQLAPVLAERSSRFAELSQPAWEALDRRALWTSEHWPQIQRCVDNARAAVAQSCAAHARDHVACAAGQ